jgi:hypothetical protein
MVCQGLSIVDAMTVEEDYIRELPVVDHCNTLIQTEIYCNKNISKTDGCYPKCI